MKSVKKSESSVTMTELKASSRPKKSVKKSEKRSKSRKAVKKSEKSAKPIEMEPTPEPYVAREPSKNVETGWIESQEAARRLGLTKQAMTRWTSQPGAPVRREERRTLVQWPQFARWREDQQVATSKRMLPTDRETALARKANAEAGLAELEHAQRLGMLVTIDDATAGVARALDLVAARLRSLSSRFSAFGSEVEAAVDREAEVIIAEMYSMDEDALPGPDVEGEE